MFSVVSQGVDINKKSL